jgi:hypothetical protein
VREQFSAIDGSSDNFQQVLTTFEPIIDNEFNNSSYLAYQPFQYRWITIPSCASLKTLDLYIYWSDISGNVYPVMIPFNKTASVLLYFRKKESELTK